LALFEKVDPDVIVVAIAWTNFREDPDKVADFICDLAGHARHVLVLGQPPLLPGGSTRADFQQGGMKGFAELKNWVDCRKMFEEKFENLSCANVRYVDIAQFLETPNGEIRFMDEGGRQMYQDYLHLSGFGSQYIWDEISDILFSMFPRSGETVKVD
jgi:hypothetical protein